MTVGLGSPTPRPVPGTPSPGAGAGGGHPWLQALRVISGQPEVVAAQDALREASAQLRWHEALRRRWREARAEAAVRGAVASGSIEGAAVPAPLLREAVAAGSLGEAVTEDPSLDAVAGLWRAHVSLGRWMPSLRGEDRPSAPPAAEMLTSLHRDVTGPLAARGTLPVTEVAIPRSTQAPREGGPGSAPTGTALAERLEGILQLIELPAAPALVRCAVVHAEMALVRPFTAANAALGRLLVRHLLTRDGLEPTGVSVPDLYGARAPAGYAQALAAYASGTAEGVVAWVLWQAEAVLLGIATPTKYFIGAGL